MCFPWFARKKKLNIISSVLCEQQQRNVCTTTTRIAPFELWQNTKTQVLYEIVAITKVCIPSSNRNEVNFVDCIVCKEARNIDEYFEVFLLQDFTTPKFLWVEGPAVNEKTTTDITLQKPTEESDDDWQLET